MHAAALFAATPKSAGAHAAGALALDPAKPEDAVTGDAADAFTQALAGLMGVTAGPTATAIQPTTSDASQASAAKAGPLASNPTFAPISQADPAATPATSAEAMVEAATPAETSTPTTLTPAPAVTVQATTVQTIAVQTAASQTTAVLAAAPVSTPLAAAPDDVGVPTVPASNTAPPAQTPVSDDQVAPAPAQTPSAAATPVAFSALSFSVKFTGAATTPAPSPAGPADAAAAQATAPEATAPQAATPQGAPPQVQPLPPLSEGAALASTPASLTLTPDEAAAALPTQALAPIKATAPSAKASTKPDAASAPAAADADPTATADQPTSANPAPASLSVVADAADRAAKSTSDGPGQVAETQSGSNGADSASAQATVAAPQTVAPASNLAAANGPAIVSQIAAQVAKSVDGKSTRFDIALDPAGLGHVDVKVEIGAQGQVTAQLSFDNAHAAAAAKSQAGQLQQALEQAGFNISQGGLSFDVGGQGAGFARQDAPAPQPTVAAVQTPDITDASPAAVAAANSPRPNSGVDITI